MNGTTEIALSAAATPSGLRFDYSALDPDTADAVMRAAESIKYRKSSIDRDIIGIGSDLLSVKACLGHGQFGKWIDAEFAMTPRTAQNYMRVVEVLGPKYEIVSHLQPATLYALVRPSVPSEVRAKIVEAERLPDSTVRMMLTEAMRNDAKAKHRRALKEALKARQKPKSPQTIRREERQRQKDEEARLTRDAARARVVTMIVNRLGEEMPNLLDLLGQVGPIGWWGLRDDLRKAFDSVSGARPCGQDGGTA